MPQCSRKGQPVTDINDTLYDVRDIRTHDIVTGEELLIVYFPREGVVTINGYTVSRSQKLRDLYEKAVFYGPLCDKPFTVATTSLTNLFF